MDKVTKSVLISLLIDFFKEKYNIDLKINNNDLINGPKINKAYMSALFNKTVFHKELMKIISDLNESIFSYKSNLSDELLFIRFLFENSYIIRIFYSLNENKYNIEYLYDLCNIIIFFVYLYFLNNEEINETINKKILEKDSQKFDSGDSYSNYINDVESNYDKLSNRILYIIVVYLINEPIMADNIRKMFESITKYSLGLLNDNNEENIFTIRYNCFLNDRHRKDHLPNDRHRKDHLPNDYISKQIIGCMVFTRHDTIGMDDLDKNCKCTEKLTDQEKIINGNMCSECRRRMNTSNFPFIIFKMNGKFYLNDLARNFEVFDCKKKEKIKNSTQIEVNEVNTYNYGNSTIVLQVLNQKE